MSGTSLLARPKFAHFWYIGALIATLALLVPSSLISAEGAPAQMNGDLQHDTRALQSLLGILGLYEGAPTGQADTATARALAQLQRQSGLPPSGELDAATLHKLGGPAERLAQMPRFRYTVRPGDTLSQIALRFRSNIAAIVRLNPAIHSVHHIVAGTELVIPVEIELPESLTVERTQVLPDRFLGSYSSAVPFTEVHRLAESLADALRATGFAVEVNNNPLDGITLRGRGVVLGRLTFSAQQSNGRTRVDVGLLFQRHEELAQQLETELLNTEWPNGDH